MNLARYTAGDQIPIRARQADCPDPIRMLRVDINRLIVLPKSDSPVKGAGIEQKMAGVSEELNTCHDLSMLLH